MAVAIRGRVLISVALLGLATGCIGTGDDEAAPTDATDTLGADVSVAQALEACARNCFEPTVAVGPDGRVYVTSADTDMAVSDDGGATFSPLDPPPLPAGVPPGAGRGDQMVQVSPGGRVFYSALLFPAGIQVAASDDGGATWATNTLLAIGVGGGHTAIADRQWLAFGPDDVVYVAFQRPIGRLTGLVCALGTPVCPPFLSEVVIGRSDDGGATFGPLRSATMPEHIGSVIIGPPVVAPDGAFHLAHFAYGTNPASPGPYELRFLTSRDGGETFERSVLPTPGEYPGAWFPVTALGPDGALHVAWDDVADHVFVASSRDGGATWEEPVQWSAPDERARSSPWALARADGGLDVVYFVAEAGDETVGLVAARGPGGADATAAGAIVRSVLAMGLHGDFGRDADTDFAHAARAPDGALLAAWSDAEEKAAWVGVIRDAPAPARPTGS